MVNAQLEQKQTTEKPFELQEESNNHNPSHQRSSNTRNLMTLALGLAGARIGMTVGGTIANACIIVSKYRDHTLKDDIGIPIWNSIQKAAKLENPELKQLYEDLKPYVCSSLKGVAVGAVLFAIPAAVVGWQRGDRVEHIKDVICKPKDTFHRLVISDEQFEQEYEQPTNRVAGNGLAQQKESINSNITSHNRQ